MVGPGGGGMGVGELYLVMVLPLFSSCGYEIGLWMTDIGRESPAGHARVSTTSSVMMNRAILQINFFLYIFFSCGPV